MALFFGGNNFYLPTKLTTTGWLQQHAASYGGQVVGDTYWEECTYEQSGDRFWYGENCVFKKKLTLIGNRSAAGSNVGLRFCTNGAGSVATLEGGLDIIAKVNNSYIQIGGGVVNLTGPIKASVQNNPIGGNMWLTNVNQNTIIPNDINFVCGSLGINYCTLGSESFILPSSANNIRAFIYGIVGSKLLGSNNIEGALTGWGFGFGSNIFGGLSGNVGKTTIKSVYLPESGRPIGDLSPGTVRSTSGNSIFNCDTKYTIEIASPYGFGASMGDKYNGKTELEVLVNGGMIQFSDDFAADKPKTEFKDDITIASAFSNEVKFGANTGVRYTDRKILIHKGVFITSTTSPASRNYFSNVEFKNPQDMLLDFNNCALTLFNCIFESKVAIFTGGGNIELNEFKNDATINLKSSFGANIFRGKAEIINTLPGYRPLGSAKGEDIFYGDCIIRSLSTSGSFGFYNIVKDVLFYGNLSFQKINFQAGTGVGKFRFVGSSDQTITSLDGVTGILSNLVINKPNGTLTLANNLNIQINYNSGLPDLTLTKGKIVTGTNTLTFVAGNFNPTAPLVTGGSIESFVDGKFSCVTSNVNGTNQFLQTLRFPVGKGAVYAPVTLFSTSASKTQTVEYFGTGYNQANVSLSSPLRDVSLCEYWNVSVNSPTTTTHTWGAGNCSPINKSILSLARHNSGNNKWETAGNNNITGDNTAGSITSNSLASGVHNLTFGYRSGLVLDTRKVNTTGFTVKECALCGELSYESGPSASPQAAGQTYLSMLHNEAGKYVLHPDLNQTCLPVKIQGNSYSNHPLDLCMGIDANGAVTGVRADHGGGNHGYANNLYSNSNNIITFSKGNTTGNSLGVTANLLSDGVTMQDPSQLVFTLPTGYTPVSLKIYNQVGQEIFLGTTAVWSASSSGDALYRYELVFKDFQNKQFTYKAQFYKRSNQ